MKRTNNYKYKIFKTEWERKLSNSERLKGKYQSYPLSSEIPNASYVTNFQLNPTIPRFEPSLVRSKEDQNNDQATTTIKKINISPPK